MANSALLLVPLAAGAVAEVWNPPPYRRWPWLTLAVTLVTGLLWALVGSRPEIMDVLARDPRMLSSGQVWRAVTALFAQDADATGIAFNLFWLVVLGIVAERRMPRLHWLVVYVGGGAVTEFLALGWQPHGSGDSIACCALAGALCGDWRAGRWRWWRVGAGVVGIAAAIDLLAARDIHGIGFFAGLAIGLVLTQRASAKRRAELAAAGDNVVIFAPGSDTLQ